MRQTLMSAAIIALLAVPTGVAHGQGLGCEDQIKLDDELLACNRFGPQLDPPAPMQQPAPEPQPNPLQLRVLQYAAVALKHKVAGLASYYSTSLDGTLTATGEI